MSDRPASSGEPTVVTLWARAWNARDGAAVAAAFAENGVRIEYALPGARLVGRDAIAAQAQAYVDAVPDCRLHVLNVVAAPADDVTVEWLFSGTHVGDLPGLPAHGEPVALHGVSVLTLRNGLIREERVYWDAATLFAEAGVLT